MPAPEQPHATPSPRQVRRQEAARRLLAEGLKLMAARGVQACRVEEITAAAGVGKGTFFTHFASKEAFVAQLVDQVLGDLARRVRPLGLGPSDGEALLAGVGTVHLRYFQLRPEAAALLNQACGLQEDSPAGRQVGLRLMAHLDMVADMLAPAAGQLGWPAEHGRELALAVLALSCGFFWFGRPLGLGRESPAALLDRLGRMAARGLARRE
ncbi:MAG: TetR/AcrR family transcriptional regulator [Pseudomonadota bacterium]